jgi:S-adenosylmethionine decarboxylase
MNMRLCFVLPHHRPAGLHAILDAHGSVSELLNDSAALCILLRAAVERAGATVLQSHSEQFQPQGVTVLLLLAESHASMHTYPEHGAYMADIFTCGDVSPEMAAQELAQALGGIARISTIQRGQHGDD